MAETKKNLETHQEEAGRIASSFEPTTFNPVSWHSNYHVQTIGALFVRNIPECATVTDVGKLLWILPSVFKNTKEDSTKDGGGSFWHKRERIEIPDGDWFHVDYRLPHETSHGTVIIQHGLESNSGSSLCIDMAKAFLDLGLDVAYINFQRCSGEPNDTIGGYHLGFTDDFLLFLDIWKAQSSKPVYLAGFSLGANVIKALGEPKERAVEDYNIAGAAAFCVPLDSERNALFLARPGVNRVVYTRKFLRSLQSWCHDEVMCFCDGTPIDKFDYHGSISSKTTEFDNAYIAPSMDSRMH